MVAYADRVKETTTTTGTGDLTLAGAVAGFQTFSIAYGTGVEFFYCIAEQGGAAWEVGRGSLSNTTTLVRSQILASSNSGSAVNFGSGAKDVFSGLPADAVSRLSNRAMAIIWS